MLRIVSRKTKDLAKCLEHHMVLTGVKQRMVGSSEGQMAYRSFEENITSSFEAELKENSMTMEDLMPGFNMLIPARWWIGENLYSPYVVDLQSGLEIWRKLHDARGTIHIGCPMAFLKQVSPAELEQTWPRLLQAYLDVWKERGRTYSAGGLSSRGIRNSLSEAVRLDTLYKARVCIRQRHEEEWNRCQMLAEEKRQRRQQAFEHKESAKEARALQRERNAMFGEERRQRRQAQLQERQEARERRHMQRAERESRCKHQKSRRGIREPLFVRAERRIDRLLARWVSHEKREAARKTASVFRARRLQAAAALKRQKMKLQRAQQEARAAREKTRRARLDRDRRWREMNRRDLTMAEILGD
eukprot:TRINITY_DN29593_c0_g2_i1.p1 TRINITY_DN29593_c0_g2~~TRINITY_DN29593_c0_g2_i1.p1  ORF type:complete len:359 (+),score=47.70 TRINITY_DN29593_c0_g2_i1:170-1246(+)